MQACATLTDVWKITLLRSWSSATGRLLIFVIQKAEERAVVIKGNAVDNDINNNIALAVYECICV